MTAINGGADVDPSVRAMIAVGSWEARAPTAGR
jgi:hypothetical protein